MAIEIKEYYSTPEAINYLNCHENTIKKYRKQGLLQVSHVTNNKNYFRKCDLDAVKTRLLSMSPKGGRPGGTRGKKAAKEFQQALSVVMSPKSLEIPGDGEDEDDIENYSTPQALTPNSKEAEKILRGQVYTLIQKHEALKIIAADLLSTDWKARHSAAQLLFGKVLPNLKSIETIKSTDEDTRKRQERAMAILTEVQEQMKKLETHQPLTIDTTYEVLQDETST